MADYKTPVGYQPGLELAFPHFTVRYDGHSVVKAPVTASIQKWHFTVTAKAGETQELTVTSVQRPPAPVEFTVDGKPFTLTTWALPNGERLGNDELAVFQGPSKKLFP
jgi:hypothetical protein